MKLILITGMSGAGKGVALKTLEDCGFEAMDNLPLGLLPAVAKASSQNLAIVADIRSRDFSIERFMEVIKPLKNDPTIELKFLFLDCDDEVIRRRFTETRRRHPAAADRSVIDSIRHERERIGGLRDHADVVIDTTETEAAALRERVTAEFANEGRQMAVVLTSFSFRRGVPRDADLMFDVRFLKNPHYEPTLKELTGTDASIGNYIASDPDFSGFFSRLTALVEPLLPRYLKEGKHYLTIALGCTGGRHRSVYVVQKLGEFFEKLDYKVTIRHRDVEQK